MRQCLDPTCLRANAGLLGAPRGRDLVRLRMQAGLSPDEVCSWIGRHRTSLARMERDETRICCASLHLLCVLAGWLPFTGWDTWLVREQALVGPEGAPHGLTSRDLKRVAYAHALAAEARRILRELDTPEEAVCRALPYFEEAAE